MADANEAIERIAPKLNQLQKDPNARVHYELMSGGLVWSDELPPWDELEPGDSNCLRGIWRFRSSLILGIPEEKHRRRWEQGQKLFPNWPGFLPERQSSSWRQQVIEQGAKLLADWEALDERYRRQRLQTKTQSAAANGSCGGPSPVVEGRSTV